MSHKYKILFITFFIMSTRELLFGQLEDISHKILINVIQMEKLGEQFVVTGNSETYPSESKPEGVAVLLDNSTVNIEAMFRFFDKEGNLTEWIQGSIITIPFSKRSIIYIRDEICQTSTMFDYKVISYVEFPEILSAGIFLPDIEEYPEGNILGKNTDTDLPKPVIIPRSEWGARSSTHGYSMHPYFINLTLHHAAGFSAENLEEGKEQMRAIQDLHQFVRGWSDIGYHFVVDKAGNIYQGRPETVIGAHVLNNNTGNIGVCVLGCYHPPELYCGDWLTEATTNSLISLYAWISGEYNYDPNVLRGHRDYPYNQTSCPGNNVHEELSWFREEIKRYMDIGGPPLEFNISRNYPNPFNGATHIDYQVPVNNHISIIVYDIMGREVKTLIDQVQLKGTHTVGWDGKSENGKLVGTGVYLLQFTSNDFSDKKKMIFLR